MRPTLEERFWAKVSKTDTCWFWMGCRNDLGYGYFRVTAGIMRKAHRIAYALCIEPIPDNLDADHICRNRACVNPAHIEPVQHIVNCQRGSFATKAECPAGHAYTIGNTRREGSTRKKKCRECDRLRHAAARKAVHDSS